MAIHEIEGNKYRFQLLELDTELSVTQHSHLSKKTVFSNLPELRKVLLTLT